MQEIVYLMSIRIGRSRFNWNTGCDFGRCPGNDAKRNGAMSVELTYPTFGQLSLQLISSRKVVF